MIKSIIGVALRFFKNNKLIVATSIISVMISLSLIITMGVFMANAEESMIEELEEMYGKMDIEVGFDPDQEQVIDQDIYDKIEKVSGVEEVSNVILEHFTIDELNSSYYTVGLENDSLAKSRYHFTEDINGNEVSINQALVKLLDIQVGSKLTIEGEEFILKEVLPNLEEAGKVTDVIYLNREKVEQINRSLYGFDKIADYALIKVGEKSDPQIVSQSLKKVNNDFRVDIALEEEFLKNNLEMLLQFMIVLSFLIILITSLFIISNFELFIYKYKYELSILRSIGGSRWQVFKIIFIQSLLINSIGSVLALLFSFISYRYLQTLIGNLFSIEFTMVYFDYKLALISVGICAIVIQTFMLIPAYRSSKLLPVTAIQESEVLTLSHVKLRKMVGISALCVSLILLLAGSLVQGLEIFILIGSGLFLLGIVMLIPLYLSNILECFLNMTKKRLSKITFIAIKSTIPQIQKNSFIILIISIMMLIVVFGSSFIETIQKNDENYIKQQYETEILIENRIGEATETDSFVLQKDLEKIESISSASIMSHQALAEMELKQGRDVISYAFADFETLKAQGLLDFDSISSLDGIILSKSFADKKKMQVGDKLILSTEYAEDNYGNILFRGNKEVSVGAIVEQFPYAHNSITDILIDWNSGKIDTSQGKFEVIYVEAPHMDKALEDLERLQSMYPELAINSLEKSLEESKKIATQRWVIFITVLIVILISVLLGVINTFINHIHSKRKELAILRTLYLTKRNMVQYIFTQITVYLVIGVLIGVMIGILFTTFISMIDTGFPSFNVSVIAAIALMLFIVSYIVIMLVSQHISKLNLSEEINKDII